MKDKKQQQESTVGEMEEEVIQRRKDWRWHKVRYDEYSGEMNAEAEGEMEQTKRRSDRVREREDEMKQGNRC